MVPIAPLAIFGMVFNGTKGMVPLMYVIGLVAMIFTALATRRCREAFPIAGSVYSYAGRGINDKVGFFAGWAILLDYLLVPTLLYVFAAESMVGLFPGVPRWIWAIVFVLVNTVDQLLGIESPARPTGCSWSSSWSSWRSSWSSGSRRSRRRAPTRPCHRRRSGTRTCHAALISGRCPSRC